MAEETSRFQRAIDRAGDYRNFYITQFGLMVGGAVGGVAGLVFAATMPISTLLGLWGAKIAFGAYVVAGAVAGVAVTKTAALIGFFIDGRSEEQAIKESRDARISQPSYELEMKRRFDLQKASGFAPHQKFLIMSMPGKNGHFLHLEQSCGHESDYFFGNFPAARMKGGEPEAEAFAQSMISQACKSCQQDPGYKEYQRKQRMANSPR